MLTKIFRGDVRAQLMALLATLFALPPQHKKRIVPALVRARTTVPARNTYIQINKEP